MTSVPLAAMRHSITIEAPSTASDGQGGFSRTGWSTYYSAKAKIAPLSARVRVFAMQRTLEVTHEITIRFRADKAPTEEMRVNFTVGTKTRIFQIKGVINVDEYGRYMTLLCKEGVGA